MTKILLYSISLALIFFFTPYNIAYGQSWNNTSFNYDNTDHPYGYKRHECGGALLNVNGENIGVIIGGRGSNRKALRFHLDTDYIDVGQKKAPYELHHVQAVAYDNTKVIAGMGFSGGYPNETPSPNILQYDYTTDSFSTLGTIPEARRRGSAASVIDGDWLYFFSGLTQGHIGGWVNWTDRYNITTGEWQNLPDAPRSRDHSYAIKEQNKVYLIGGRRSNASGPGGLHAFMVDEVDVFDLTTLTWASSPMSIPTSRAGALVSSRYNASSELEIAVWGGETSGGVLTSGDLLNLNTLSSSALPALLTPRHATVLFRHPTNNKLYTFAGAYFEGWENEISSISYAQQFSIPGVFPVEWLSVKAKNGHTGINVEWEVAEHSVNHYRIERKSYGSLWQIVGSVASQGDGENSYRFTDATPTPGTEVVYRIVSTDYDGSLSYSRIMELGVDTDLFAYPNPVKAQGGFIQFSVHAVRLELMDAKGSILISEDNSSKLGLTPKIAPGLYFLRVFDEYQLIYARKILVE